MLKSQKIIAMLLITLVSSVYAEGQINMGGGAVAVSQKPKQVIVPMHYVDSTGVGAEAGTITITESAYGLVFKPELKGLVQGVHGFHLHQNASCASKEKDGKIVPAQAAGGHYDPAMTNKHEGPWGNGHLGDLPALYVAADGTGTYPVLAPRLKFTELFDHALMIHGGGDNHADHPAPLGGGGARVLCGVVTRELLTQ
jgi:superoxide dismutase, Cu-Zn family